MGRKYITTEGIVMVNLSENKTCAMEKGTILEKDNDLEVLGVCLFKTDTGQKIYVGEDKVRKLSNGSIKKL